MGQTTIHLTLALDVPGGLDPRHVAIKEPISDLFEAQVVAVSENASLDLDDYVGCGAAVRVGTDDPDEPHRVWAGVVASMSQLAESGDRGTATYLVVIVPTLWRATLRRNCRIFAHQSTPEVVLALLAEWGIAPLVDWTLAAYPKHELCVQYRESDYVFICRLLEQAGISFYFSNEADDGKGAEITRFVLDEKPENADVRPGPLHYVAHGQEAAYGEDFITALTLTRRLTAGRRTVRDFDFRGPSPDRPLLGASPAADTGDVDFLLEDYEYAPGAVGWEQGDSKKVAEPTQDERDAVVARQLTASRAKKAVVSFATNALDVGPGSIISVNHGHDDGDDHPHDALSPDAHLLVIEVVLEGTPGGWVLRGKAVFAAEPYLPERRTPKPHIDGVQSALVVGADGRELDVDELGRVLVQFHWDREGEYDGGDTTCRVRVSEAWAGGYFGTLFLPRVGHEVLVDFLEGDPDRPIVVGRVHNVMTAPAYKLPEQATVSYWRSSSTPGGGGYNEIAFEDARGMEAVAFQAQKDMTYVVNHDVTHDIGTERVAFVGESDTLDVGKDRTVVVGDFQVVDVGGLFSVKVGEKTELRMTDGSIVLSTSTASVDLGAALAFDSGGSISIHAGGALDLSSTEGNLRILAGGAVAIDGGPDVFVNPAKAEVHGVSAAQPIRTIDTPIAPAAGLTSGPPFMPEGAQIAVLPPTPLLQDVVVPKMAAPSDDDADAEDEDDADSAADERGEESEPTTIAVAREATKFVLDHVGQPTAEVGADAMGLVQGVVTDKLQEALGLKYTAAAVAAVAVSGSAGARAWALTQVPQAPELRTLFTEAGERLDVPAAASGFALDHAQGIAAGDVRGLAASAATAAVSGGELTNLAASVVLEKLTGQPVSTSALKDLGVAALKGLVDRAPLVASGPAGDVAVTDVVTDAVGTTLVEVHDGVAASALPYDDFQRHYDTLSSPGLP